MKKSKGSITAADSQSSPLKSIGNIPQEMCGLKQWVCWKLVKRDSETKPTKIPINPKTGRKASSTNPKTWVSFDEAVKASSKYDGIGFVFTQNNPYCFIDLDHCADKETGEVEVWALEIVNQLDSYTEISPSGTGLHIFCKATLPRDEQGNVEGNRKGNFEIYDNARYSTVTGNCLPGTPETIKDRQEAVTELHRSVFKQQNTEYKPQVFTNNLNDYELLEKACNATNGDKFDRLMRGDYSDYPSQSEADSALCNMLAFWCGNDSQRIDSLFRQSRLYRDKWDKRHHSSGATYGQETIRRAIANTRETYIGIDCVQNRELGRLRNTQSDNSSVSAGDSPKNCVEHSVRNPGVCTQIKTWKEAFEESPEDRLWTVEGIFPQVGLAILGGWRKEGKTTLAIDLMRKVNQGLPFLGRVTTKSPGVYINYEIPADYRAALLGAGAIPENAFWIDRPERILSINTIEILIKHVQELTGTKNILVVLDTLRGAFRLTGDRENSVGGVGVIVRDLQKVALDYECLIVLIHHTNKDGAMSGSGDIQAAADILAMWKRPNPNEPGTLEIEGRMAPVEPLSVSLSLEGAEYLGLAKETASEAYEIAIFNCLTDDPMSADQIASETGLKPGSVRVYLKKLYDNGEINRTGTGKRNDPFLYCRNAYTQTLHNTQNAGQQEQLNDTRLRNNALHKDILCDECGQSTTTRRNYRGRWLCVDCFEALEGGVPF